MRSERSYFASSGRLTHSVMIVVIGFILGVSTAVSGGVPAPDTSATPRAFVVDNTHDDGPGSLRWAIEDANNSLDTAAIDSIDFSIPGTGPHTIQLATPLPAIIDPVVIDGFSQAGSTVNERADAIDARLMIELDGSRAGIGPGLSISAGSTTVRGLWIHGFGGDAIRIEGGGSNCSLPVHLTARASCSSQRMQKRRQRRARRNPLRQTLRLPWPQARREQTLRQGTASTSAATRGPS